MSYSKSHVTMESQVCIATGKEFQTNTILLDRKLSERFDGPQTCTGFGISPEVQEKIDEGYCVLVEIDSVKSKLSDDETRVKPEDAYRTGTVIYLKKKVYANIIDNINPPLISFIDKDMTQMIEGMS